MKLLLSLVCFSTTLAAAPTQNKELVLNCVGAVYLATNLAQNSFLPTVWSMGEVTTADVGKEEIILPSELPGEILIRKVHVVANTLPGNGSRETKSDVQFQVKGDPYLKDAFFISGGEFRFVKLNKWRWHEMPGFLVFRFATDAKGENSIQSPCKIPRQWASFFTEAAALREQHRNWFSSGIKESDVASMRNESTATNPLWRLCVMCRLLELKQLRQEDIKKMLQASAGKTLELGALLVLLLKDTTSHEQEIMAEVRLHGRNPGTAEGLALGCLTSAADKPKAVERAFDSMTLLKNLKADSESSMQDNEKMIDVVFQGDIALEYRVAHKLNMMISDVDDELRRKVEGIFFYMLEP